MDKDSPIYQAMQITRATDYAVRIMIHLAALPNDVRVAAPALARGIQAPPSFVLKVLQRLTQAGMVVSRRGVGGGFQLAVQPENVSLLDVVEMLEGPLQVNACLPGNGTCDRKSWCGAYPIWGEAQAALKEVLARASLAQLACETFGALANNAEASHLPIQPNSAPPVQRKPRLSSGHASARFKQT